MGNETLTLLLKLRDDATAKLQGLRSKLGGLAKNIGTAVRRGMIVATAAITGATIAMLKLGSDAVETKNLTKLAFGEMKTSVENWARSFSEATGTSRYEAVELASNLGILFDSMGFTSTETAELSTKMVELAGDMSSAYNVPLADSLNAIRAAVIGETEPMRKFGVVLNAARIKQEGLNSGLIEGKEELNAKGKALSAVNLILDDTTTIQGDLIRTQDDVANKFRGIKGALKDVATEIGIALQPALNTVLDLFVDNKDELQKWGTETAAFIKAWLEDGGLETLKKMGERALTFATNIGKAAIKIGEMTAAFLDWQYKTRNTVFDPGYDAEGQYTGWAKSLENPRNNIEAIGTEALNTAFKLQTLANDADRSLNDLTDDTGAASDGANQLGVNIGKTGAQAASAAEEIDKYAAAVSRVFDDDQTRKVQKFTDRLQNHYDTTLAAAEASFSGRTKAAVDNARAEDKAAADFKKRNDDLFYFYDEALRQNDLAVQRSTENWKREQDEKLKDTEEFINLLQGMGGKIKGFWDKAFGLDEHGNPKYRVRDAFGNFLQDLPGEINKHFPGLAKKMGDAWKKVRESLSAIPFAGPLLSAFGPILLRGFAKLGKKIWNGFKKIFGGPSEAEKLARQTYHGFREEAKVALADVAAFQESVQAQIAQGQARNIAEAKAAFQVYAEAAGVSFDEANRLHDRFLDAIKREDNRTMEAIMNTVDQWKEKFKEAQEKAAGAAKDATGEMDVDFDEFFEGVTAERVPKLTEEMVKMFEKGKEAGLAFGNAITNMFAEVGAAGQKAMSQIGASTTAGFDATSLRARPPHAGGYYSPADLAKVLGNTINQQQIVLLTDDVTRAVMGRTPRIADFHGAI